MSSGHIIQELPVTFSPALFLQRRGWVFEMMRREGVSTVVDIGCGEGETIGCLCNPAPWRAPLTIPSKDEQNDDGGLQSIEDTLHVNSIHALDVCTSSLRYAAEATAPAETSSSWLHNARWEPLDVKLWRGGLESFNPEFVGVDCIISTEVIEHLPEDILSEFAPMLLGVYHPRLLLITTPSYTFNARFTAPDAPESARSGFRDSTGRTSRIFRHSDHKFEWTIEEFAEWCTITAADWGYEVEVSGVGRAQEKDEWGRDDELGWATQVAAFRRREGDVLVKLRSVKAADVLERAKARPKHEAVARHHHEEHALAGKPSGPRERINNLVKETMQKYREAKMTVHEIWFEKKITILCGGFLHHLILALESDEELFLNRHGQRPLDWVVEFGGLICETSGPKAEVETGTNLAEMERSPGWTNCDLHPVGLNTADDSEAWWPSSLSGQRSDTAWGSGWASSELHHGDWGTESWKDGGVATEA